MKIILDKGERAILICTLGLAANVSNDQISAGCRRAAD